MTEPEVINGERTSHHNEPRDSEIPWKEKTKNKAIDLDDILVNELGQFGRFQLRNLLLVSIPIIMSAFLNEFIFSAAAIPHRCRIPECGENNKRVDFQPEWIRNAIPSIGDSVVSCERFQPIGGNGTLDYCPANLFNQANTVDCDRFVYARDNSVVYDFDLGCQDWLRVLAGTFANIGGLLVLPITGYVSDNYGRRIALVISIFNLALFGLIRAFSVNYPMYLAFQFIQSALGAGTYSSAYVFGTELVGPKWRVLTSASIGTLFAIGQIILGSVAWLVQPWRYMIMTLHTPCFLIVSYYWLLSESVRWLLSRRKFDEARDVLLKVAKVNKKDISDKSLNAILNPPEAVTNQTNRPNLIKIVVKSPILLRRVCTTPIWWITTTFVFYGLSINATGLSGNMYLNFILTCAVEIPGNFAAVFTLDRFGRKPTVAVGFLFTACCNLAFAFISEDLAALRLALFLMGKFGISAVLTGVYLYTAELYPTEYRHTLLAFSSMIGRIGSVTAPLTPVLANSWQGLPSLLFGIMGLISGVLTLTQPETSGLPLPDTIEEAEAIGKTPKKT